MRDQLAFEPELIEGELIEGEDPQCLQRCEAEFQRCLRNSLNPLDCLARRSACLRACAGPPPPRPPTPGPPVPPPPTPTLRRGARGAAVADLQRRLNAAGANPPLVIDGIFGPKTDRAVREFQRRRGLAPDGVVGPLTWGALLGGGGELELEFEPEALGIEGGLTACGTVLLPGQSVEGCMIRALIAGGERDRNKLTDKVFQKRHPELGGRRLKVNETQLIQEWKALRQGIDSWLSLDEFLRNLNLKAPFTLGGARKTSKEAELEFDPEALGTEQGLEPCGTVRLPGQTAEGCAIRAAIAAGQRDRNKLTDLVFRKRHPELGGRALRKNETKLVREWLGLRELVDSWLTIDEMLRIMQKQMKTP